MLFIFLVARTRNFAKQSYSHQKKRAFVLLFFTLLEEGEVDDGADQCTENTHGNESKDQ